jgi:hypothetical protein
LVRRAPQGRIAGGVEHVATEGGERCERVTGFANGGRVTADTAVEERAFEWAEAHLGKGACFGLLESFAQEPLDEGVDP